MVRVRRFGATLAVAGLLCMSLALSPTPLSAAPSGATAQLSQSACDYLAQAIAFLESKPQTPLRDFLLATLRRAQGRYCVA